MRTKTPARARNGRPNGAVPLYRTVNGKRMVLLDESEYERLRLRQADEWKPLLPEPNADYCGVRVVVYFAFA